MLASPARAQVPITLYQSFAGNVDFTGTGNTLRAADDTSPCALNPSSSATLTLPPGAILRNAFLYWAGSGSTVDPSVVLNGAPVTADRTFQETFTLGGTSYDFFAGFADLTGVVTAPGAFTFSGLSVNAGAPHCGVSAVLAGWSLIAVYERAGEPLRVINLYDGFRFYRGSSIALNASNFETPNPLAAGDTGRHAHLTWEGDSGNSAPLGGVVEELQFDGNTLTDALNPPNNQFNSTLNILGSASTWGVDLDLYDITPFLAPGQTSATTRYASGQDLVLLSVEIFSVPNVPVADLALAKTHAGDFGVGSDESFTLTVTNQGPSAATGATVTDTLPAGLTYVSGTGSGWSCGAAGQLVTCSHAGTQAAGTAYPPLVLTVAVDASALPGVSNTATVSGPEFDHRPGNDSSTDAVVVREPDLSGSTKTVVDVNGGTAEPGDLLIYTLTLVESAGVAAPGAAVSDDIPAELVGFTVTSTPPGSTDASAPAPAGAFGAGRLDVSGVDLPAGGSVSVVYEATIAAGTPAGTAIVNTASVAHPNGPGANPSATVLVGSAGVPATGVKHLYTTDASTAPQLTRVRPPAQALVVLSEAASLDWVLAPATVAPLEIDAQPIPVELWLTERGPGASRTLQVDLFRSPGLTPVASLTQTLTLPNGAPAQFTLNLPNAALHGVPAGGVLTLRLTNLTTGSGDRRIRVHPTAGANFSRVHVPANTVINVDRVDAYDAPYPAGAIPTSFAPGATAFVRAEVSDPFGEFDITAATVEIRDPSATPVASAPMTRVSGPGVHPAVYEYAYAIPAAGPAGAWSARASGFEGTEPPAEQVSHALSGSFAVVLPVPSLVILKSVATEAYMAQPNPKAVPGASLIYTLRVTNTGPGPVDLDSLVLTDPIPPELEFFAGDFDAGTAGPVRFDDGTPASGLTYTFVALGDPADDVDFQTGGGPGYGYTPAPGYDPAVSAIRIHPKGVLAASGAGGDPYFELRFRVRVR